jgi:hypothetical protein
MTTSIIRRSGWHLLLLAVCVALGAGCTSWNVNKNAPWPVGEEKPKTPDKIVSVWTDTVLYRTDKAPERGFGGRLMFYQGKKEQPVKVDGTIVVYAFDETNRAANNSKPDRKYVFTPEQIPAHYSKSKIGHSYSLWIPWDAVGGLQREISLVVRFEPKGEPGVVMGEPARQILPGVSATATKEPSKLPAEGVTAGMSPIVGESQRVQQASYNAASSPAMVSTTTPDAPARRMTTTTISIPSEMAGSPLLSGGIIRSGAANGPVQSPQTGDQQVQRLPPAGNVPTASAAALLSPATGASAPPMSAFRPRSRFAPHRPPAPAAGSARPAGERVPSGQCPGVRPSAPGSQPAAASASGWPVCPPAAE